MLGGINPAQMQGMMKKMGISQFPLNVSRVIFEMKDERIIIDEPSVMKVTMQGQETYQVSGEARTEEKESFSSEDVAIVMEKTRKSEKDVKKALASNGGDIALAIMELK